MNNLLIIEPHMSGHHGVYLRWIVSGAIERKWHVIIGTLKESDRHPIFRSIIKENSTQLEVITLSSQYKNHTTNNGFFSLFKREIIYRRLFKRLYDQVCQKRTVDFVLIPYLDYCAYANSLLGSPFGKTSWGGIVMRPSFHYAEMGAIAPRSKLLLIKKMLFYKLLYQKKISVLFTIDPLLSEYFNKIPRFKNKTVYLPDPVEMKGKISKEEARERFKIPKDAVVVLVYGAVSYRKGVDVLISALNSPDLPNDIIVLIAGKQDDKIVSVFNTTKVNKLKSTGRFIKIDKFLGNDEEYAIFKASDIVWLGYREHYNMSGVLIQAVTMGLPIIACNEGLIGWYTKEYNLGTFLYIHNQRQVVNAILLLLKRKYNSDKEQKIANDWVKKHSKEYFNKICFGKIDRVIDNLVALQ